MAAEKTPVAAILGVLGTLGLIMGLPRLFARRPPAGPRLRRGEKTAASASSQASKAYWAAEEAASRGNCDIADRAFQVGEYFRAQAEERRMRGDYTGRNLRDAVRHAKTEMRKCNA